MAQSTPGPRVFHCLPELGQIHVGSFDDTVLLTVKTIIFKHCQVIFRKSGQLAALPINVYILLMQMDKGRTKVDTTPLPKLYELFFS